jgi:hypothetical protein
MVGCLNRRPLQLDRAFEPVVAHVDQRECRLAGAVEALKHLLEKLFPFRDELAQIAFSTSSDRSNVLRT